VRAALIVATVLAALVLLLRRTIVLAAAALVIVGWSLTGEVNASNKSLDIGQALVDTQPRPLDWIDRATGGAPAVYVGQAKLRTPEILSLAFWNDSVERLVTLGGEPVYGLIFETHASRDGRLSDPARADYVVSDEEVEIAETNPHVPLGHDVQRAKRWRLQRVDGPVRVDAFESGIWQDGWQEERSAYTRFGPPAGPHYVHVGLSQKNWCGPDPHSQAEVRVVDLRRKRTTVVRRVALKSCVKRPFGATVPVPRPPFDVRTTIAPTFVPHELIPSYADTRHLGAQVTYKYLP